MKVKLLQHIMEGGSIKAAVHRDKVTPFTKDAILEVGESTGKKWIEKGWAEAVGPTPEVTPDKPQVVEAKPTETKPVEAKVEDGPRPRRTK